MSKHKQAVVYCHRTQPFRNVEELTELFMSLDRSRLSYVPPVMPKGGEVYMFTWKLKEESKKNDWRCDQHRWRNNGSRKYPSGDPKFTKYFHTIITEDGKTSADFQRNAFTPIDLEERLTLVHYFGDETLSKRPYINKPKNNARRLNQKSTNSQSVTPRKRQKVMENDLPSIVRTNSGPQPNSGPRFQDYSRSHLLDLLDLRELAFQLGGFIQTVMIVPQALCVCGSEEIVSEFVKVLDLHWSDAQLLWLNTSIKIGNYYVSPLVFRHLLFDKSPTLPVVFAIHHQPLENCISDILLHFACKISNFVTASVPIVVERKVSEKVKSVLPNAKLFFTWNDIREEARNWMLSHSVKDTATHMTQLTELLEAKSQEQFDTHLSRYKPVWDTGWLQFFSKELETDIRQSSARWILQDENIFSSYTGTLTQSCQEYDMVTDGLVELDNVTPDMTVLALYHLHNYLTTQVRLAQCGQPAMYNLRRQFRQAIMDPTEVNLPDHAMEPEYIVATIREQLLSVDIISNEVITNVESVSQNSYLGMETVDPNDNEVLVETGPEVCEVLVAQSAYETSDTIGSDINNVNRDQEDESPPGSDVMVQLE